MVTWIEARTIASLRPALDMLVPELRGEPIELRDGYVDTGDPRWARTSAFVAGKVVKFAWTEPAALKLAHEISVMRSLTAASPAALVAPVCACSFEPVLLVTDFEPGRPLTADLCASLGPERKHMLAHDLATVVAAIHSAEVAEQARDDELSLPPALPQATTSELRSRLLPRLARHQRELVEAWCDWVDEILDAPAEDVLLHGDFHGFNLVLDTDLRVRRVLDFEEASHGDYHYDFRYLPAQENTVELFRSTADQYGAITGRPVDSARVMAWHVRAVLGDALWRTEAGVPLPDGGTTSQWIEQLSQRFDDLDVAPC